MFYRPAPRSERSPRYSHPKAAYYNKQKFLPRNVLFWSFDIVLRLNRELGGVWRLGMICSTHRGGSRTFSRFSVAAVLMLDKQEFLSMKNLERSKSEKYGEFLSSWPLWLFLGQKSLFGQSKNCGHRETGKCPGTASMSRANRSKASNPPS